MYWYYKIPLVICGLLLGFGIVVLVWRSLPEKVTGTVTQSVAHPFSRRASETAEKPHSPPPAAPTTPPASSDSPGKTSSPSSPSSPSSTPPRQASNNVRQILAAAETQFAADNYIGARQLAAKALKDPSVTEFDREWFAAAELINRVDTIFMSSQTPSPERKAYTIQPGDSLSRIAQKFHTSIGALQRVNDLDRTNPIIYPGNVLYILQAAWRIRVSKRQFVLLLYNGPDLYRLYRVGIGKQNRTPVGTFVISSKVIHPAWTPPGRNYPFGDPKNPLGTHWLGLSPVPPTDPTLKGYGIHGTWKPDTIGTGASQGCIRMLNEDVSELFDFIPEPGSGIQVNVNIED